MADVEIALLGSWQVRLAGQLIARFPTVKVQALLAYLAVEAETAHPRDTLNGLLWGEYRADSARQNLRKALQHLRQLLPSGYLLTTNQTVQFNPASDYALDVTQFTQLVDAARQHRHADLFTCPACMERLQQAVALYRGDFLAGFFVADSPAFEEWVLLKREWLRREALAALHQLAASYEQQGEYQRAYGYAWRQVELDPVREEAHQQLMRILALSGQRSEALTQYETCRRILAAELAVEPAQETVALVEQIRTETLSTTRESAKAASPWPELTVASQARQANGGHTIVPLPIPPTPLIGREQEVEAICHLLLHHPGRLLTLVGPPGIGKTRLGLAVAAKLQAVYPDGVYFVPLAATSDAELVASTLVAALGISDTDQRPPNVKLIEFLRHKEVLLLLDNFEQITAAAPLVAELLAACPGLRVLVTSRERLHLRAEQRYRVSPLDLAAAVALFVQRAQTIDAEFALTPANQPILTKICQYLDCLPLAIELSAARVDLFTPQTMLVRLQDHRLELPTDGSRDLPVHHRTLRDAIHQSYVLLNNEEKALFRTLGVFVGGFDLEAVTHFGFKDGTLYTLINKSLVRPDASIKDEQRFFLLETLSEFAREQLAIHQELDTVQQCHAHYFLALAEEAESHFDQPDKEFWYDRLEREHDNLRAVLRWSLCAETEPALRLAGALREFWSTRGYFGEGRKWLAQALAQTNAVPSLARGEALRGAGKLALAQGDYAQATAHFEESLALYQQLGDKHGLGSSLNFLGAVALYQNDLDQARRFFEESLVLRKEAGDQHGIAGTLDNLGIVAMHQGDYARAKSLIQEGLAIGQATHDTSIITICLHNLGYNELYARDPQAAAAYFQESLTMSRQRRDPEGIIYGLEGLAASACLYSEDPAYCQRAARLFGAAQALRNLLAVPLAPMDRSLYEQSVSTLRIQIGENELAAAWAEGQAMPLEQVVAYALATAQP